MSPMRKSHHDTASRKRIIFESSDSSDSSNESQPIKRSHIETPNVHRVTKKDEDQLATSRQYLDLKYDVKQILNKLEVIERLLNVTVTAGSSHSEIENNFLSQLPLGSISSINEFDAIISENTEKFNSLVQLLYLVGGDTNKKIIYNMLRKVLTNEAATYYSGQGRKKKLAFVDLKLYDAVMSATRSRQKSITEVEVRQFVSLFLATAKSRL